MAFARRILGRTEKRLPIAIVVNLAQVQDEPAGGPELTYTDNISAHGARVISRRAWQTGEVAELTSRKDATTIRGTVTYCEKLPGDRYGIGLNFHISTVTWSTYLAYA